jgi:uncharacterized protein YggE
MTRLASFVLLALVATVTSAVNSIQPLMRQGGRSTDQCCSRRTFSVSSNAFEPVLIDQATIFVSIQADTGLGQSELAVQRASDASSSVLQILRSGRFPNVTNIQVVGVQVSGRTNFSCDTNGNNCRDDPIGFSGRNTISFNAPLSSINALTLAILAIQYSSIQSQQGFVPPEIFGQAQNIAIKRAMSYAQYRAEQTISGLPNIKLGLPISIDVSTNDYLETGGSANGAVRGTANIVYEIFGM